MEAVPRLPMISFELKTSVEKTSFQAKLKDFIRYHYNEGAESYSSQIFQIEALRFTAVKPTHDVSGCNTMKRYYCQLHFLLSRFPMGKDGEAAVKVSWKDPYTENTITVPDISLEMASVLYNIGALHSQLGAADNRTTPEGMKMACTHFQCAAWAFQHVREEFPQTVSYDDSSDLSLFMNQVCLAQAQECLLEKSMMDNRKPTITAKVAIQTVEYYKNALKLLKASVADEGAVAETFRAKHRKKWEKYLKFKISYHGAIDMLYRGQQAEEEQKMGERVAYCQAAFDKLQEARKLSKGLDKMDAVNEALQFTTDVVEGKRKAATNENEFIYHEEVPDVNVLPEMKGASLVKGIGFNVNDIEVSGPDIFGRLIPLTAHETSSIYSEELSNLLRKTTAAILKREGELDTFLSTLQLDELKAREDWKLPQDLIDRCAALSAKPDAVQNLVDSMNSLSKTYEELDGMLSEIRSTLQKEEEAVLDYEGVVGKQSHSIASTDLTREANWYQDAHSKASDSNKALQESLKKHIANLRLLSLPPRELREKIPAIAFDSADDQALKEMQNLMNKVKEMKTQRGMLMGQLREAINRDDITHLVVTFTGENKEELFQKEMQKHQKQINLIKQNLAAQDKIIAAIQEAYPKYSVARKNVAEKLQIREGMVAELIASYDAYEDLLAKSNKGLEFYGKLQTNVSKLFKKVKSTCEVHEEEREQMLKKILKDEPRSMLSRVSRGMSSSDVSETTPLTPAESLPSDSPPPDLRLSQSRPSNVSGGPKLKHFLNMKKETGKMSLSSGATMFGTGGYMPVPSPHVYDTLASSWVPAVRPAPVGSEETETPSQRTVDSDLSSAWNPTNSTWGPYAAKGSTPYNYPLSGGQGYQSTESTYANAFPYQVDQSYQYQNVSYPSSTNYQTPIAQGYGMNYGVPPTSTPAHAPSSGTVNVPSGINPSTPAAGAAGHVSQVPAHPYLTSQVGGYQSTVPSTLDQSGAQPNPYVAPPGMTPYSGYTAANSSYYSDPGGYGSQASVGYPGQSQNYLQAGVSQQPSYGQVPPSDAYSNSSTGSAAYDQQSMDGSCLTSHSSTTSINSVGALSTNSQTSLTTAYSDPYVNETAMKSHESKYPSNTSSGAYAYGGSIAAGGTYTQTSNTPSYYPSATGYTGLPAASYENTAQVGANTAFYDGYSQTVASPYHSGSTGVSTSGSYATTPQISVATSSGTSYQTPNSAIYSQPQGNVSNETYQGQYIPQMGGGYQQAATYLQSGNSSTYTNTLQSPLYNTTSSSTYSAVPNTLDLKPLPDQNSSTANPYNAFIPQPAGNTPTQSPATYQQAGFVGQSAATNTINSSSISKSSSSVNSSNIDLLAGLEFDVQQSPLVPENTVKTETVQKASTEVVVPATVKSEVMEEKKASLVAKKIVEEKKMDVEALNAFVPEVEKYEKFVEGLTIKTLNGPTTLDVKWKEISDLQEKDSHNRSISVARCYPMKNRYADILPYDDSRIELPSTKDDYINASLLKPISGGISFILTQAPLPVTYADFWTMVLEQQVEVIICLLADMELEGHIYWPTEKGQEMELGRLRLLLQTCNVKPQWTERIISVSTVDTKVSRIIVHLQFTSWPGSSFPPSPAPFLSFVGEARTFLQQQRNLKHPAVVHCHSGVGRSGLFCLILQSMIEIEAGHGIPDLVTLTANMSQSRKNCLRDREHLKFAYQSILYFCQDLLLRRGILTNKTSFEEKKSNEGKCHTRHPSEDFLVASKLEQIETKLQNVEIDDKKREGAAECTTQQPRSVASSGRSSPNNSLLAAMDPNSFNLSVKDGKSVRSKPKFTSDNFTKGSGSISNTPATDDPLSSLDPLWSLKK